MGLEQSLRNALERNIIVHMYAVHGQLNLKLRHRYTGEEAIAWHGPWDKLEDLIDEAVVALDRPAYIKQEIAHTGTLEDVIQEAMNKGCCVVINPEPSNKPHLTVVLQRHPDQKYIRQSAMYAAVPKVIRDALAVLGTWLIACVAQASPLELSGHTAVILPDCVQFSAHVSRPMTEHDELTWYVDDFILSTRYGVGVYDQTFTKLYEPSYEWADLRLFIDVPKTELPDSFEYLLMPITDGRASSIRYGFSQVGVPEPSGVIMLWTIIGLLLLRKVNALRTLRGEQRHHGPLPLKS